MEFRFCYLGIWADDLCREGREWPTSSLQHLFYVTVLSAELKTEMDRALLAWERWVSSHFWNRNGHANHDKWLSSASNLTPATKRKQGRICTDKRHLVLFDVQHYNLGHFNLSWSESLFVLWGLRKGEDCYTGIARNVLTWHQRLQRADPPPNMMMMMMNPPLVLSEGQWAGLAVIWSDLRVAVICAFPRKPQNGVGHARRSQSQPRRQWVWDLWCQQSPVAGALSGGVFPLQESWGLWKGEECMQTKKKLLSVAWLMAVQNNPRKAYPETLYFPSTIMA